MINTDQSSPYSDTFFMPVFDGVQSVFRQHRLDLVALLCSSDDDPVEYLRRIAARGVVDGIILSSVRRNDPRLEFLSKLKIPFVTLGRSETPLLHPWIDLDFEGVAEKAVSRLYERGYRRIGVAIPDHEANLGYVFKKGWQTALGKLGLVADESLVFRAPNNERGGYAMLPAMLEAGIDSVILVEELMASGIYLKMFELGLVPGQDIGIVGFRDNPQTHYLEPRLTAFRVDLTQLGREVGKLMVDALDPHSQTRAEWPGIIWPLELVPGASDPVRPAS